MSEAQQKRNLAEYEGYYNDAPALKVGQVLVRVDPLEITLDEMVH